MQHQDLNHIKKAFVKQYSQYYCGLACMASVIQYYGGETSQERLRDQSGTTLQGTSLLGLYQCATKEGFDAKGFQADIAHLKTIEVPVILHVLKEGNQEHYIICYGFANGKFVVGDPAWGVTEYNEEELEAMWKTKAMLWLKPNKSFQHKSKRNRKQRVWFTELIKDDMPVLFVAVLMGAALAVLGLATAVYTQKLIDDIIPSNNQTLLFKSIGIFTAVLLVKAFLGYIRGIFLVKQSQDMNNRIISSFFNKLLFLPLAFFDSITTGDMIGRLNDSQRIQRVVINLSSNIVIDLLIVLSSLTYIYTLTIATGLLATLAIPLFAAIAFKYNRTVIEQQKNVMQAYALTESRYIDTLQGIEIIKSGNKEPLMGKMVQTIYRFFQERVYELGLLGNKINLWAQIGSIVLIAGIILFTSLQVLSQTIQLGEMMAIITLTGGLVGSVINIAMANIQFQEAKVAFERMFEFADIEPEYQHKDSGTETIIVNDISITSLNYRFSGKRLLLKEISFDLKRGEIITIFGEIGCGKSTLLSILQRFYLPESGRIIINGSRDWNSIETYHWRNQIAYVPQHARLFNTTVLDNIALEENLSPEKIITFCREIGIEPFINEFQQGYTTIVGENSSNLSGGQQQLISIARALYQKPTILLLDEATAAMDRRTEHFVIELLNRLKKDMIIVFVTHRVQLANQTDKIVVIENQSISAIGAPDEVLLKGNNVFSRFN